MTTNFENVFMSSIQQKGIIMWARPYGLSKFIEVWQVDISICDVVLSKVVKVTANAPRNSVNSRLVLTNE